MLNLDAADVILIWANRCYRVGLSYSRNEIHTVGDPVCNSARPLSICSTLRVGDIKRTSRHCLSLP